MNDGTLTFDELVAFALGELSDAQRGRVEAWVQQSEQAKSDLADIQEVLANLKVDALIEPPAARVERVLSMMAEQRRAIANWPAQLTRVVGELIFDTRRRPALAGFRGSQSGYQVAYTSSLANVDLQVSPAINGAVGKWRVRGQVMPQAELDLLTVSLIDKANVVPIAQSEPNLRGQFELVAGAGQYDLVVKMSLAEVIIEALQFG